MNTREIRVEINLAIIRLLCLDVLLLYDFVFLPLLCRDKPIKVCTLLIKKLCHSAQSGQNIHEYAILDHAKAVVARLLG